MAEALPVALPENPRLVRNVTWFARALRKAGLPIGTGRVIDAVRAVEAVGFTEKRDFYWVLHASFVTRPEHRVIFAQVFRLFWRDPRYVEHMMAMLLPALRGVQEERAAEPAEKRAAESLLDGVDPPTADHDLDKDDLRVEIDATQTASSEERLKKLDFEQMSTSEMAEAKRALASLALPVKPLVSRRTQISGLGDLPDWRGTMRAVMRRGGELQDFSRKKRRQRWPNLIALCDISGSMSQYSRIMLHFLHAVSNKKGAGWAKVNAFTFGTQLTNITRHLRQRDVDAALAAAGAEAQDWQGGTRIGKCLHGFNRDWSRRVMGQGAVVLLISDGLERDNPDDLAREMERLRLSARRIIWLNPLLRYDGFSAKAAGVRAMLPYVDSFRSAHNLASLEELAAVISSPDDHGEKARLSSAGGDDVPMPATDVAPYRTARNRGANLMALSQAKVSRNS